MKKKTFLISIILMSTILSFAQLNWEKHESNPVMQVQPGTWYSWNVFFPVVIHDNGMYKMWFCGNNSSANRHIGYAESLDGLEWEILDAPVISGGDPGAWAMHIYPGSVLSIGDTLHMWFSGSSNSIDDGSIGYAWSVEGHVWNVLPEPVLEAGVSGAWDSDLVFHPSVYYDGTVYHMYYSGSDNDFETGEIGHATSIDGVNWEKDNINNPVISLGSSGTFYDTHVISGHTIMYNDTIGMYFTGTDGTSSYPPWYSFWRIGYAWSTDYINWVIHPDPVVDVGATGAWDESIVAGPSVLIHDGHYHLWYWGDHYNANWEIGYACGNSAIIRVPSQQPTIQAGIDAACNGSIVLVDDNTYYENINFKGKAITVASQFLMDGDTNHINNTIIDGSQSTSMDSTSVVYFISGEDTTSIIVGFTIQGGSGTPSSWGDGFSGGGIFCAQSGAKIENNNIVDNHCVGGGNAMSGGGMFADTCYNRTVIIRNNLVSENSCITNQAGTQVVTGGGISVLINAVITGNTIKNNYAYHGAGGQALGGGIEGYLSKCIIKNNIIRDNIIENTGNSNQPNGSGIFLQQTQEGTIISGNLITGNQGLGNISIGGGIATWNNGGELIIDNNIIENNDACRGSGLRLGVYSNEVKITNNIIRNNFPSANNTNYSRGGGIYFTEGSADSKNIGRIKFRDTELNSKTNLILSKDLLNVIANNNLLNNSSKEGGGIFIKTAIDNLLAFNNILYNNSASLQGDAIYLMSNTYVYLYHNDIDSNDISGTGNWEGEGNIFVDPEFDEDGYHLLPTSQCIEAGITSIEINDVMYHCPDFDIDGESRPFNDIVDIGADEYYPQTWIQEIEFANNNYLLQNFPNPFSGYTTISFLLESDCFVEISIYDLTGKKVQTIINKHLQKGKHKIEFDAGRLLNGIYFCQLKTDNNIAGTRKMIVLK